jgi:hypothetical protein
VDSAGAGRPLTEAQDGAESLETSGVQSLLAAAEGADGAGSLVLTHSALLLLSGRAPN